MGLIRQLLIVGLIAGLGVLAWETLEPLNGQEPPARSGTGDRERRAAVVAARVGFVPERVRVKAVGTARAHRSARLHPAAAGQVETINFAADRRVAQGDVLLELDRATEELAVDLARVRLADADRVFRRLQRLSSTGAAAQVSLDDAHTALEAARIELKRAEVALADRFVLAPFAGHIGLTEIEVGDRVDEDTEIATLDDRSSLLIRFEVPEALHGRLGVGAAVRVTPWADDEKPLNGTVADVGSRVSERTRTFVVRARIANPDDRLRPGMSFRVRVDVEGRRYPEVPEIAIQWGGEGSYLWVVTDGAAHRVPAVILQRQGGKVLVEAGLREGDLVVVEGLHRMRDGVRVDILPAVPVEAEPLPARIQGAGS
ncbi:hemolysin D [Thalassobaculum fulvum]|uniref:Hemolysin D n=1 Tax=Thalassobaculum fulvum TaxID=1633335 RepID=A0A919CQQ5_9PROT|nr:efflux RND transporter periplasmic adaptor subunit [Thalassobaculum fulvum]GHD56064.1 hemolysin D [Thalassobaculum fulvum]